MKKVQINFYVDYLANNASRDNARIALNNYCSDNTLMALSQFSSTLSR